MGCTELQTPRFHLGLSSVSRLNLLGLALPGDGVTFCACAVEAVRPGN